MKLINEEIQHYVKFNKKINLAFFVIGLLLVLLSLSSCSSLKCKLQYPLDGKAYSFCRTEPYAVEACKDHGGVETFNPFSVLCNDKTDHELKHWSEQ